MHFSSLSRLLNIFWHCWPWLFEQHFGENECCCGISLVPAKLKFPLLEGPVPCRNWASSTWDFAQKCIWALTGRHLPRSWPPTSLPAAHTLFSLPNHQMWDVSQHRKETSGDGQDPESSAACYLPRCQDSCIQSKQTFFSIGNISSCVASNHFL